MANRKIILKQPIRDIPKERVSYNLPKQSKTVKLAQLREEPRPIQIAQDLMSKEETLLL